MSIFETPRGYHPIEDDTPPTEDEIVTVFNMFRPVLDATHSLVEQGLPLDEAAKAIARAAFPDEVRGRMAALLEATHKWVEEAA